MDANTFPAGLRVLAVDDDRISLMILERQLKQCNYNVTGVTDAKTALDMLREKKNNGDQFDLVISDVVMPNMDGFKLLELISLEMDLPVIMLSANSETQTMMKGIKHGACDYLVKPVRLEQLRGIWTHVVKNSKTDPRNSIGIGSDDAGQKLPPGDGGKGEKVGAKQTRKYSKKNKNDVDGADEDSENTSNQKRQRVQWSGQLHCKFVEAVNLIGIDRAVPKKILQVMNVEGLTRENVASHLQKYRIFLRKLSDGTLRNSSPFAEEALALHRNMNIPENSKHQSPSFVGSPSSSNHFANMNSSSGFGANTFLPTPSVQIMGSQRNLGIPLPNMEPVNHGVNIPKHNVPMTVEDISRVISSGKSYAPVSSGGLPAASQCFPSGPSGSSYANISNGVVVNTSKPFSVNISGTSFGNISNDSPSLTSSMRFSSSRSWSSYASILRGKILGSSKGIPFEDIADGEVLAPSGHSPLQSSELVNLPSDQPQSSSAGLFNNVSREACPFAGPGNSWKPAVPSRFPDLGCNVGMSIDPSQGNIFKINQLSRFADSSGQILTFGNECQKETAGIMGKTTPMVGSREQLAPFSFGRNTHSTATPIGNSDLASSSSSRPGLQINNSAVPTQVLNGGGASGNLHEGSTVNQQAVTDQVNNINEFLLGTSEAQNEESGDLDEFLAYLINQPDSINNAESFIDGDWDFTP